MKRAVPLSRYLVFFALAIAVCAADLGTKTWMFGKHPLGGRPSWLWEDVIGVQTTLNEGALFGMGRGLWMLFAALSVGAAIGILVWLFLAGAARDWLLMVALAFVTGGIFGNLYDRLGLPGLVWAPGCVGHVPGTPVHAVRDFILVMIGPWNWPNFNLADSSLVCGAALLAGHAFFAKGEGGRGNKGTDEAQVMKDEEHPEY